MTKKVLTDADVAWMQDEPHQMRLFPNLPGPDVLDEHGPVFLHTAEPARQPLVANRDKLIARVGRDVSPELFTFKPWGHRVVILRDEALRTVGKIHIPDAAQVPPACGTVVSVGPDVGTSGVGSYSPVPRERLVGSKVLFGKYSGQALRLSASDDEFETAVSILAEGDIWGLVGDVPEESIL